MTTSVPGGWIASTGGRGYGRERAIGRAIRLNLELDRPTAPLSDGRVLVFARDADDRARLASSIEVEHNVRTPAGCLTIEVLP